VASLLCSLVAFGVLSAHLYRLYLAVPFCLDEHSAAVADTWVATAASSTAVASSSTAAAAAPMPMSPPPPSLAAIRANDMACMCGLTLRYADMTCETVRRWLPPALTASSAIVLAGILLAAWQSAHTVALQRRSILRGSVAYDS